jgi:hypothetical protein
VLSQRSSHSTKKYNCDLDEKEQERKELPGQNEETHFHNAQNPTVSRTN